MLLKDKIYIKKREQLLQEQDDAQAKGSKWVLLGIIIAVALITLMYFTSFPLSVFQDVESNVRENGVDISIMSNPDWISEQHEKTIQKTVDIYTTRRDEIIDMLIHSEITDAAIAICKEKVASGEYGETAEFGGYSWFIPEAADEGDIKVTASEVDQILYLYSCLYDEDFASTGPDFYEKWLYGSDSLPTTSYTIEAFGNKYDFVAKGGYYLEKDKLEEAKKLCYEAGMNAVYAEIDASNPLMRVFNFFVSPFITKAYADNNSVKGNWAGDTFVQAYMNCYDMFCAENGGAAFIDTVIYTGVSDQMSGEISFSLSGTAAPMFQNGADSFATTIEDYIYGDNKEAATIINGFITNPFAGRVQINSTREQKMEVYVTSGGEYTVEVPYTAWEVCYDSTGSPMLDENGNNLSDPVTRYRTETRTPAWEQYKNVNTFGFTAQAYPCKEMVNFVFQASVNGSGVTNALSKLLSNAYGDKGNIHAADYGGADIPWCAKFVGAMYDEIGLHITNEAGCAYWHSILTGELGTTMPDSGEPCRGYKEYDMSNITCWGGDGYTPQIGDIVIWNDGYEWNHIGYVVGSDDWSVTIANGNNGGGMVQWGEYTKDDGMGLGNGCIIHVSDFDNIDIADLRKVS